ncbi:MAG: ATP-binding protein [Curvibacter sp.]
MSDRQLPGPALALRGVVLDRTFPFHLVVGRDMRVRAVGPSLRKLLPHLLPGELMLSHLQVSQPPGIETYARWLDSAGELVILRSLSEAHVVLRGTVESLQDEGLIFLVTAVAPSLERMRELGLGLRDFALHDSQAEHMRGSSRSKDVGSLQRKIDQLHAIIETGEAGVLYAAANGDVVHVNRVLCEQFGIDDSHVSGLTMEAFVRHLGSLLAAGESEREPVARLLDLLGAEHREGPTHRTLTLRLALPRRSTLQMSLTLTAEQDLVLSCRDITHETEVDRMKSEFLSTAAHELRTPLASIFGFTELLMMRKLPQEQQRELLGTIHRQAELLIKLINELLDLSRIESRQGKDFHRQFCRVGTIVEQTIKGLLVRNDKRQVQLYLPHASEAIMIDSAKTMQALLNVLSNAFKYSPDGGDIELETRVTEEDGRRYVGISVRDHGIGISPNDLTRVFDRFWRADPSGAIPGTGLGLSLVKEIVELQDGKVQIESAVGEGTTVTLWFPLTEDFVLSRPSPLQVLPDMD